MDIAIAAGTVSTVVFAVSNLPMLRKAVRTRDVSSYSLSSLVMINGANVVYSLYVFTLPVGPIWALHTFYLVSCAIMLVLCVRQRRPVAERPEPAGAPMVTSVRVGRSERSVQEPRLERNGHADTTGGSARHP